MDFTEESLSINTDKTQTEIKVKSKQNEAPKLGSDKPKIQSQYM